MNVLEKIDAYLDTQNDPPRNYLGASIIGIECDRQLWYKCHAEPEEITPRTKRIFSLGDAIEQEVVLMLHEAGFEGVWTVDPKTKKQYGFNDGVFGGHVDGVLKHEGVSYAFDVKSASKNRFGEFKRKELKDVSREYYIQILLYVKYLRTNKGMVIFYNKDNSEMHIEIVEPDGALADIAQERALDIYNMEYEPERRWSDPTFFKCRWCHFHEKCWGEGK